MNLLMDGLDSGNLDRYACLCSFQHLNGSVQVLPCKLGREKLSILTCEDKRTPLEEGEFCR